MVVNTVVLKLAIKVVKFSRILVLLVEMVPELVFVVAKAVQLVVKVVKWANAVGLVVIEMVVELVVPW